MRWLVLPVALCAVSPAAFAMDPSLRGFYIGGAIGNAVVELEDDWSGDTFDADDTGFKIIAGYRIIDWVAVEVNYSDYGDPVDRWLGADVQMSFEGTSISALGMLPLGNFDLFGRLGISRLSGDLLARGRGFEFFDSNEETEPMIGLGAQYRPTPNLAIRLEAEGVLLDASNDEDDDDDFFNDDFDNEDDGDWVSMLSLGVTYKF